VPSPLLPEHARKKGGRRVLLSRLFGDKKEGEGKGYNFIILLSIDGGEKRRTYKSSVGFGGGEGGKEEGKEKKNRTNL